MAKRSSRGLSKKGLPHDLKRITKDGIRVWVTQGKEFATLREVVTFFREGKKN